MKKNTILLALLLLAGAAAALTPADIADPMITIICGVYRGFKLIAGGLAALVIVYGGIKWTSSADDPAEKKNAKTMIKHAMIALIIILVADQIVSEMAAGSVAAQGCMTWRPY